MSTIKDMPDQKLTYNLPTMSTPTDLHRAIMQRDIRKQVITRILERIETNSQKSEQNIVHLKQVSIKDAIKLGK